ncbi:MAG: DUF2813 domain-containing protein [Phycisphaerae bacterium]|nr:DUF2813 domain-containing protein [Phycisphaerae bacterium]
MRLAFVGIRHYRGIQSLDLPLGSTTTLIGENAYGKSNLLDALLVCLGAGAVDGEFAFLPGDFHPRAFPAGSAIAALDHEPIVITLGFRETKDDEWQSDDDCEQLRSHVYAGQRGDARLTFRVVATLAPDGERIDVKTVFIDADDRVKGGPTGQATIELLRKRSPFLLLKADRYFTRPSRVDRLAHEDGATRPLPLEDRLAAEVTEAYLALSRLHEPRRNADFERGLDAARAYVERFGGDRLRERVQRFLPQQPPANGAGVSLAARSMALMMILGGILDAKGANTFGPGAMPTVAIEDAEAYLHPVVLASVAAVMQAIPAQKLITTNSGELLSMLPLPSLRRLVRGTDRTHVYRTGVDSLSNDDLRRIGYHVKANRGTSLFARCWLLVEGESEFWLLPQLAEVLGVDFALEGVRLMEFAQCGVDPLIRFADDLGIEWHILCDGDSAGRGYRATAESLLRGRPRDKHISIIAQRDIEHCLWEAGYAEVYRNAVKVSAPKRFDRRLRVENPTPTIERAVRFRSKPGMAITVAEAAAARGPEGVPAPLKHAILATAALARASVPE